MAQYQGTITSVLKAVAIGTAVASIVLGIMNVAALNPEEQASFGESEPVVMGVSRQHWSSKSYTISGSSAVG